MLRNTIVLGGGNRSSKIKVSPKIFNYTDNTEIVIGLAKKQCEKPNNKQQNMFYNLLFGFYFLITGYSIYIYEKKVIKKDLGKFR